MLISNEPLDQLVEQETFAEMLALLEPEDLVIAALRLEGLTDAQIADLLGIARPTVSQRMQRAQAQIMERLPELAPVLRDRQPPHQKPAGGGTPPLERGWLCRWTEEKEDPLPGSPASLTVADVAWRCGVTSQTVRRWIRAGRFPNAYRVARERGEYRIPEEELVALEAHDQAGVTQHTRLRSVSPANRAGARIL